MTLILPALCFLYQYSLAVFYFLWSLTELRGEGWGGGGGYMAKHECKLFYQMNLYVQTSTPGNCLVEIRFSFPL